jgi:hypothetical protein
MRDSRFNKRSMAIDVAACVIRSAGEKWPTTFVARTQVPIFTGGTVSTRTMANKDNLGEGPSGAFRIGRNVAYPIESLCDWLIQRSSQVNKGVAE